MIVGILTLVIAYLALNQNRERMPAAIILAVLTMAHYILFDKLEGNIYFEIAIIVDLLIIESLLMLPNTKLIKQLVIASLCFIILNASSLIAWEYYLNYEQMYDSGTILLYLIIVTFLMEGYQNGNYRINWKDSLLWMFGNKSRNKNCEI